MPKYVFCPQCGSSFVEREMGHRRVPVCPRCDFVHWRNPAPCAGALVIRDGKVLLVRRGIEPYKGCWDIPGGFMESNETPEQAVAREMLEETGLKIFNLRYLIALPDTYGKHGVGEEPEYTLNIYFLATAEPGTAIASDDVIAAQWFAPDELPSDNEIAFVHSPKVIQLLRTRRDIWQQN